MIKVLFSLFFHPIDMNIVALEFHLHNSLFCFIFFLQELSITNPIYLFLGASFGSSAKGTGLKALEFALSICDSVDMYGFTVDPGYKEW